MTTLLERQGRTTGRTTAERSPGRRRHRVLRWAAGGLLSACAVAWLGLRVEPAPLPAPPLQPGEVATTTLPADLPAPVSRFYRQLYGDAVPVVRSAVVSGRGTLRINGVTLPARFRFSHVTGQAYRHHIQTTVYGVPLLTVDERYLDGTAVLHLPFGTSSGPQVDQGANLALWAEAVWMPSAWVTDDRVRWEPVDDTSARLVVPFGPGEEVFTVRFDPRTGLLRRMESMRYKGETATAKTLWVNEVREWEELDGHPVPRVTTVTWGDEDSPWAVLRTEDVVRNADLTSYIAQTGS